MRNILNSLTVLLTMIIAPAAAITVLHEFQRGSGDGRSPFANGVLSADGLTIFGTTDGGGANGAGIGDGILWQINTDGSGYTILHDFADATDGSLPRGGLVLDGDQIYGTAKEGGSNDDGTIWTFDLGANTFDVLHVLDDGANADGSDPSFGLTLSGTTLYGTADSDGSAPFDDGTLFALQTDGSGFTVLHDFSNSDPANAGGPNSPPIVIGSQLVGTSDDGGAIGEGTIYTINDDGTGFDILHSFAGSDGSSATGGLTAVGATLFGVTEGGGDFGDGTLFSINADGSGFTTLLHFDDSLGDSPVGGLTLGLDGITLFGLTSTGGTGGRGSVFSFDTSINTHTVLHSFANDASEGRLPLGPDGPVLSLDGSALFGTTVTGGPTGGRGTIWRLDLPNTAVPEPATVGLVAFGAAGLLIRRRRRA